MTTWSKLPPRQPCYALFRGVRHTAHNQTVRIDEPVEVLDVYRGQVKELGVAMFGRQTRFRLDKFDGEWLVLEVAHAAT